MSQTSPAPAGGSAFRVGIFHVLLLAVPAAFVIRFLPQWNNATLLFFVSGLGIVPLAYWMGRSTESLSDRTGAGVGGLLNATFGNAPELIFALMALSNGVVELVKASIIGSIISNILVVLGISMIAGGIRFPRQLFNQTGVRAASTSLMLAAIGLLIPSVFHNAVKQNSTPASMLAEQNLSIAIAVVLLVTYLLWLVFSLITHANLFLGKNTAADELVTPPTANGALMKSIIILALSATLIAFMSEFVAISIEDACRNLGLSEVFVGIIVVAIIGNAAESSAITVAIKNKMDLTLGITIGSSLQIALFVTPLLVLASHLFGQPMNLDFSTAEITSVLAAIITVVQISGDGECNWVEGVQLLSVYLIIAILFYFLPTHVHSTVG